MSDFYSAAPIEPNALSILGVQLHSVDVDAVHHYIERIIREDKKALVLNLNINCVNLTFNQPWLRNFINEAQMVFCDGDGVRWGLRLLGKNPPPKITYDRWLWQLAEFAENKKLSFYFLGGKPDVAETAAQKLNEKFPELKIVGARDGYFQKEGIENQQVIDEINRVKPDILVLGFGMPVQEKWLQENWKNVKAHVSLTGGAVFDYISGAAKRAPAWMIKANMEWLFRLIQEPKRLFIRYIIGNPLFFWRVIIERVFKGKQ